MLPPFPFGALPRGTIRVRASRLSPGDVVFLETAAAGEPVRSLLLRTSPPRFEVQNRLSPEPYWVSLRDSKLVWALKLRPWAPRPKSAPRPPPYRHPRGAERPHFREFDREVEAEYSEDNRRWTSTRKPKKPYPTISRAHREWYTLLGVKAGVTLVGLKKAYRKEAFRYHPDRCKESNAEEMFKKITVAYAGLLKLLGQKS